MTAPMFSHAHGAYRFEWPEPERAILELDMVRAERSGDVTAEMTVTSTAPAIGGVIHHARVNLVGTRSRQELARHLASRTQGITTDWQTLVELACRETLRAFRAGAPAVLLRDVPPRSDDDTGHALDPLALSALPTLIFGDGGSAKSMVALGAGAAIHTGRPFAGMTPDRPRRVGLLDWELDAQAHRDRLARMFGEDAIPDVLYVPCARPLADDQDRLRRIIGRHGLEFLVVDSIALGCDGPPEAAEVANRYLAALRELGLPALCVAHVNRQGDTDRPFGSAFWHNGFRLTWYAKREADPSPDSLRVGLFPKKANLGPLPPAIGLTIAFGDGAITFSRTDVADVVDFAAEVPLARRIPAELRTGAQTIVALATSLDAEPDTVGRTLRRLRTRREVVDMVGPDGITRWGLAS